MAAGTNPPTLSFPRDIFAALSPGPFLQAHLAPPNAKTPLIRPNGRAPSTFRTPTVNASSLTHCSGSAVVRCGDTAVVCGVRGEILLASDIPNPLNTPITPEEAAAAAEGTESSEDNNNADEDEDDTPELTTYNLLVPNLELSTGCSPAHLPGNPPSALAQTLSHRILALLHATRLVRAKDLRVLYAPPRTLDDDEPDAPPKVEIKAYWTLYIDVLFISLDGNAFDAAWGAVLAALRDTRLPRAWWDADLEMVVCSDEGVEAKKLNLRGLPIPASFAVFEAGGGKGWKEEGERAWVLADPDAFEEGLCREGVCVIVDCGGRGRGRVRIRRVEKSGGAVVGRTMVRELVARAEERWREWEEVLR